ncbi:PhzF family phenazine biosynthesis protein [Streptomyces sp. NPDC003642]
MRIRIVDAFTDRPFSGNPAGVLLLDGADAFPDDTWLQHVAREVNHAETAFAHPLPPGGEADWALRWFTPATEVAMCGHATLATAHVLHATAAHEGPVRFATRSGVLVATPAEDGSVTLDFPTAPLTRADPPAGLAEALGTEPLTTLDTGPLVGDLLVEVADEKTVHALAPDLRALGAHSERGVIATARAEDPDRGYDFVSRCFFPNVGIDEDSVTGSAHTALAPFWSERLGRPALTGLQASSRSGRVRTELRGDRTLLTGRAVTVIDGDLLA